MRIQIDIDRCCGAGQCAMVAPELFDQKAETGLVMLNDPNPPAGLEAVAREAADLCPTGVIAIDDAQV